MRLVNSSAPMPGDLETVLREIGKGDSRFGGTSFGRGQCSMETFLKECREREEGRKMPAGSVPQSTYWLVDDNYRVVGIVRVRHRLNVRLLQYGGHIGYYVRPSERGKGYGKEALRLGLEQLRRRRASRALLTVNPANLRSMRVVLANGSVEDVQGKDPVSGEVVNRYWVRL